MTYDAPWPESLNDLKSLREENEKSGRGTVAAIGVVCPPLGVQIVPFGSLKDLSSLQVLPHWKDTLIRDVENGKKFTRFGY
jgi:splicing suppressor protein 51